MAAHNNIGFKAQLGQKKEVLNMAYVVPDLGDRTFELRAQLCFKYCWTNPLKTKPIP